MTAKPAANMRTYSIDSFTVAPEDQGQIVETAYGADWEAGVVVVRTTDRSDRSVSYRAYEPDYSAPYEPWNRAPMVGADLGECQVS